MLDMIETSTLNQIWKSIDESEIPDELKGIALRELVRNAAGAAELGHRGGVGSGAPPPDSANGTEAGPQHGRTVATTGAEAAYKTLSAETGIPEDQLREVILFDSDGAVHILPVGRLLGTTTTEKARNIATLIVGARHAGLSERAVNIEHVRSECIDKKAYDSGNFKSTHIGKHDAFSVRGDEIYVSPSKWLPLFENAISVARGSGGS